MHCRHPIMLFAVPDNIVDTREPAQGHRDFLAGTLCLQLDVIGGAQHFLRQLRHCTFQNHTPFVEQTHPIAHCLHLM